ncbi:phage tail protein [Nocardia wallacei]|uniref:Uncharacterized protein n=1 Tax=Nocardia wallacei TaxID=480035 RepID=A0A7G1KZ17_9NOCA|nr:hypothetical protein [Nocardia wallacei]BCK58414.1 hypothetical protein NWFMUON74_61860 [Nocardia wallacei]
MTQPGITIPLTADGGGFEEELSRVVIGAMRGVQLKLDKSPLDIKINLDTAGTPEQMRALHQQLEREARPITQRVVVDVDRRGLADARAASAALVSGERAVQRAQRDSVTTARQVTSERARAAAQLEKVGQQLAKNANTERAAQLALERARRAAAAAEPDPEAAAERQQRAALRLAAANRALAAAKAAAAAVKDSEDSDKRTAAAERVAAAELKVADAKRAVKAAEGDPEADGLRRAQAAQRVEAAELRIEEIRRRSVELGRQAIDLSQRASVRAPQAVRVDDPGLDRLRDRTEDTNRVFERLGSTIGGVVATAGGLSAITGILSAIGGAAGLAAGAVGGLALGFAALGPAAAAVAGTAVVGLQGIKDAFDAVQAASDAAPGEAAAKSKAVAAAQDQLASAADTAARSQRTLADAQQDSARAAEDVGRAYVDAGRDLEDYRFKARGAAISEKEALLGLKQAQNDLKKAKTVDDREEALVRLERAQLRYDEAVQNNVRSQQDNAEAQAKGLDGSDRVVAAKDRQAEAEKRVADAQDAANRASAQVVKAQQAVTDAMNASSPSADKLAQAMAKLSPEAQNFVSTARELAPVWEAARKAIQDALFQDSDTVLRQLADTVLPHMRDGMSAVATELNLGAKAFADWLSSAQGVQALDSVFASTADLLAGMREGSQGFLDGLAKMTLAAEPFAENIGRALGSIGTELGNAFSQLADSGLLGQVLDGFTAALQGVGPLLRDLVLSFAELGSRVLPALQPLFESIGQALVDIAPALGDLGATFADSLTALMPSLSGFIKALAEGLRPVLPVVANLLGAILDALRPMIGPLSEVAQVVGNALADALRELQPALGPLATAFADVIKAVAPLIPLIAENLSTVLIALAPAISDVANALAPVIAQFADEMRPVIKELAPILADVAKTLGLALADAIRQIAPVLPDIVRAFTDLLVAVVPLLPEFARLAAEILPPLIDIFVQMAPQIIDVIEALTWLASNVLVPVVIPAIQNTADAFSIALGIIGDAIGVMRDIAGAAIDAVTSGFQGLGESVSGVGDFLTETVFPEIGRGLVKVQSWFEDGVNGIASVWDRLREAAANPVRFIVNAVWNEGLRKAWNAVGKFLPGVGDMDPITLGFRSGGAVFGPGTGTSDSIPAWLSSGEHVITAAEVLAAGGQNIWYAIRDMIARGIPFSWDGGQLISDLGRDNLNAYGAAVRAQGIGNVNPEGLFDPLLPRFATGGAVEPWMHQLLRGHEFARAQHGRPYQWAGPRFVGDSFDCSGFMGSIAAAILGLNPWQRYWATSSFAGYPQVGPQGFTRNQRDGGMVIGVTDNPGGPGGGHTAGVLGALPLLGIPQAMRVESGGALGNVHYGTGTDPTSFAGLYGLPIGANGYFQPGAGGGSIGPSVTDQRSFVERAIERVFDELLGPIRTRIPTEVGPVPPEFNKLPPEYLTTFERGSIDYLGSLVGDLGNALPSVWQKAQSLADKAFDALNPFDSGGIAAGVGFMPKNTIQPERVLSPEQTRLFEALVLSLQQIAGTSSTAGPELLTASVFQQGIDTLTRVFVQPEQTDTQQQAQQIAQAQEAIDATGRVAADTRELVQRNESSAELVTQQQTEELSAGLDDISQRLTAGVLTPIMQSAVDAGIQIIRTWLGGVGDQITDGTDRTTAAVKTLELRVDDAAAATAPAPFGAPGSAFDAAKAISDAVVSVANTAQQSLMQVAQQVANAALAQQASRVGPQSKGVLGRDISGGLMVDLLVRLTGVEIEIRDNLLDTLDEIHQFRGDLHQSIDTSGRILSDTAELVQRNESSMDLVVAEQNRINRELIKALLRYLMTSVVIPILTAFLSAAITLAVTAIGAAIGSIIPGIGTAIGAAVGAVVGVALAGIAAAFIGTVAIGAAAAIDSFDSGGVAVGRGFMHKDVVEPERVLSPRETESFERLVAALERSGNRTVNAPITVFGGAGAAGGIRDNLLSLL